MGGRVGEFFLRDDGCKILRGRAKNKVIRCKGGRRLLVASILHSVF